MPRTHAVQELGKWAREREAWAHVPEGLVQARHVGGSKGLVTAVQLCGGGLRTAAERASQMGHFRLLLRATT